MFGWIYFGQSYLAGMPGVGVAVVIDTPRMAPMWTTSWAGPPLVWNGSRWIAGPLERR